MDHKAILEQREKQLQEAARLIEGVADWIDGSRWPLIGTGDSKPVETLMQSSEAIKKIADRFAFMRSE